MSTILRLWVYEILKEAHGGSEESNDYRLGTEKTLMLDREGIEKKYRKKIKDYLYAMGMIK